MSKFSSGEYDSGHLLFLPEASLEQKVSRLSERDEDFDSYIYENSAEDDVGYNGAAKTEDTVDIASPIIDRQNIHEKIDDHLKNKLDSQNLDAYVQRQSQYRKNQERNFESKGDKPNLKRKISKGYSFPKPQRPNSIPVKSQFSTGAQENDDDGNKFYQWQGSDSSFR